MAAERGIALPAFSVSRAPAKINLTLAVRGRRADGYHLLESLVAFASVGDELSHSAAHVSALTIKGPQAAGLVADADNLVLRAARHLQTLLPGLRSGHFSLLKRLPVASGIGGGSADAAAALRLLARLNGLGLDDPAMQQAARQTGADVPVCLGGKARIMAGIGDVLGPPLILPRLNAVLVNPGIAVATGDVFTALGLQPGRTEASQPPSIQDLPPSALQNAAGLIAWLATRGNDLERPALKIAPVIATVLDELRKAPGCRLARMSGSGATCFGLFDECDTAARAARSIASRHKNWWVKPTILR
jgi:4-diphosphocytidyl-2-C-methyl-D-erythritol kinase